MQQKDQPSPADLQKSKKHLRILYAVMVLFTLLPFIIILLRK